MTEPSELLELWQESDELEAWTKHMANLKKRLSRMAAGNWEVRSVVAEGSGMLDKAIEVELN